MTRRAPRCIRSLLEAFSEALSEEPRRELVGIYVFGSAAFPGFVPGIGDIDFIAVTRRFPSKAERERLARIHRGLGIFCSLCIFPALLADIVETGIQAIISMRVETYSASLVPVMSTAAVIKMAFLYTAVLWCVVGTILFLVRRLTGQPA
jgi:hypothetical protein